MIIKVEAYILNCDADGYEPQRALQEFEDQDGLPGIPVKNDVIRMTIKGHRRSLIVNGRTWDDDQEVLLLECSEIH